MVRMYYPLRSLGSWMEGRSVLPLRYQSQEIGVDQWFELFTLCLAPIVLHLATGIPEPTVLYGDEPGWWNRLPLFNPVSIVWRYLAIADRRLRARDWDECDMAASNAAFWDGKNWDGSEDIFIRSRSWIVKKPASRQVHLLSASTLSTLGLTAQGVNAIVYISKGSPEALNMAFYYFALLSLVRLFPAPWLSNDYGFSRVKSQEGEELERMGEESVAVFPSHSYQGLEIEQIHLAGTSTYYSQIRSPNTRHGNGKECARLFGTGCLRGMLFRALWISIAVTMFSFSTVSIGRHIIWNRKNSPVTATAVIERAFSWMIAAGWIGTHSIYVLWGKNNSTILPCIQNMWYKLYTCCLVLMAILVLVFSSLETHACVKGSQYFYTTYPCDVARPY